MRFIFSLITAAVLLPFILATLALAALTITGFLGGKNWLLDLTSHFRAVYVVVQLLLLVVFVVFHKKFWAAFTGIFLLVNAIQFAPFFMPKFNNSGDFATRFKFYQFNVCAPTKDFTALSESIKTENPDIATLEECHGDCFRQLQAHGVLKRYPYVIRKSPYFHRLVLLSRFPVRVKNTFPLTRQLALELFELKIDKRNVLLLQMHSTRPSSGESQYKNQIAQFKEIARLARESKLPFMMAGDLNATPWNYSFRMLVANSGLKDTMNGHGFAPTFPVFIPRLRAPGVFPIMPIDHILVSRDFTVLSHRTGEKANSDHLPVIAELGLN